MRQSLITGVALGHGPRKVAAEMRNDLGGSLTEALTLARQSVIQAYRNSSQEIYSQNRDVVSGWIWLSSLGSRACPLCYAMHGTLHPVKEKMVLHIACRCTMMPAIKGAPVNVKRGTEIFAELDDETQRGILGPAKYKAYTRGEITLETLVGVKHVRGFGHSLYERSLKDVRAA